MHASAADYKRRHREPYQKRAFARVLQM
jgi:hypothetical protein